MKYSFTWSTWLGVTSQTKSPKLKESKGRPLIWVMTNGIFWTSMIEHAPISRLPLLRFVNTIHHQILSCHMIHAEACPDKWNLNVFRGQSEKKTTEKSERFLLLFRWNIYSPSAPCLPACLSVCLPACLPVCLPACLKMERTRHQDVAIYTRRECCMCSGTPRDSGLRYFWGNPIHNKKILLQSASQIFSRCS